MNPVIEVRNLRKTYGEKVAVADVTFAVERGEIFTDPRPQRCRQVHHRRDAGRAASG